MDSENEKLPHLPVTGTIAQWYGSNRILGHHVGEALAGCSWVGIPFAGGMCEVQHIGARSIFVNDVHRHVINLAWVAADPQLGPQLYRALRRLPFTACVLESAQEICDRLDRLLDASEPMSRTIRQLLSSIAKGIEVSA